MRSRVPRKSVDFASIDLGDSLYSYPHGTRPDNLAPYKVLFFSSLKLSIFVTCATEEFQQELIYRKQIARKLRPQYVEGIYRPKYYTVTLVIKVTGNGTRSDKISDRSEIL